MTPYDLELKRLRDKGYIVISFATYERLGSDFEMELTRLNATKTEAAIKEHYLITIK